MNAENIAGARYKQLISDFEGKHILVMGDLMMDRYVTGTVLRISPEAPVPILMNQFDYCALGGAGNVALNVKNMGGKASLIGGVGTDSESSMMMEIANHAGIHYHFVTDDSRPTTLKTRLISSGQHLLRIDRERTHEWDIPTYDLASEIRELEDRSGEFHAVIISDYHKGFVTRDLMHYAQFYNVPIVVDPKTHHYERFKGATVLTPNNSELFTYLGNEPRHSIQEMINYFGLRGILETRGRDGVTIWRPKPINGSGASIEETIPGYVVPSGDITGAGDTFTAAVALSLANDASLQQAAEIANMAGAISVQMPGCYCPKNSELQEFNINRTDFQRSLNMEM